jgi:hypothetical protein
MSVGATNLKFDDEHGTQRLDTPSRKARRDELAQTGVVGRVERDDAPGEHAKLLRCLGFLLLHLLRRHPRAGIDRKAAVEQGSDHLVLECLAKPSL